MEKDKIDIVVTYVNTQDEQWQKDFNHYKQLEIDSNVHKSTDKQSFGVERYREWDAFKYWFRGVEKNCPWVNKVFLVVASERDLPKWLNRNHPKLRIVYHEEFMPKELLPSFNGLAITFYLSNIPDLSNNYICTDDDMYFINPVPQTYFFKNNKPVLDIRKEKYALRINNEWEKILNNDKQFLHRFMTKENECQFTYSHLPDPYLKSSDQKLIKEHYDEFLDSFKASKFRNTTNYVRFVLIDYLKLNKEEVLIDRIKESKYIHFKSDVDLMKYKDMKIICVNDTEAMDDFQKCKNNLLAFLNYKLPNKSSFEIDDEEETHSSNCFGVVSWLPDDEKNRKARIERLNKMFTQLRDIFGDVDYLIVAQNWKDYEVPDFVHAKVFKYNKLGILGARKTLGKHFLESTYNYLIMCDDDVVLETDKDFTKEYFFNELDSHPDGFMFLQYSWSLNMCAISRSIYRQSPMVDIDPERGEGYEDVVYPYLLHYKHADKEFKIRGIKFIQNKKEFRTEHKSTWENKSVNHDKLRELSDYYIKRFKSGNFAIDRTSKQKAYTYAKKQEWIEKALYYGWINKEDVDKYLNECL